MLAQALNAAIILGLFALLLDDARDVLTNIAEYQAAGLIVDNDLGQRGLALVGVSVLISSGLAVASMWNLFRARVLGFILHAFLWSLLLMLGRGMWFFLDNKLEGTGTGLFLLCLAGAIFGVVCAVCQFRVSRSERPEKSVL